MLENVASTRISVYSERVHLHPAELAQIRFLGDKMVVCVDRPVRVLYIACGAEGHTCYPYFDIVGIIMEGQAGGAAINELLSISSISNNQYSRTWAGGTSDIIRCIPIWPGRIYDMQLLI